MERSEVERILGAVEAQLGAEPEAGLEGSGFWKAVAAVKRDPGLVEEYAGRIAAADRTAFERWALLTVPIAVGTAATLVGTALGLVLVGLAYSTPDPWNGILLLAGSGVLLVATHGLAHLVAGRLVGIRFTHWFIGTVARPQPGVKTDYAAYLAATARGRAWMHASGALVSKVVPFALIPAGVIAGVPEWATILLGAVGVVSVITDILWSTKFSDWKKFRREIAIARR
ncbi:MAG: hypothetical protein OXS29_10910 [bacterium]|nr:hypothetical protein [bacterium]MDE0290728.1 hypothetical protein [bacterium]MDE0440032.1 hypothetical protein [bacterium]